MIVTSKAMTKEQAEALFNSHKQEYPNTEHNRKMMKTVVDEYLIELRKNVKSLQAPI